MVRVLLKATGQEIDVVGGEITFVKKVADIGDVTAISTSYSWRMEFLKIPSVTSAFQGLGIVGDASRFPYKKQKVVVLDNGVPIVQDGLLKVTETNDKYVAHIQEGIIDFYNDVQDDKISEILDLSSLDHQNDFNTITASFNLDTYRYIIASYNGPFLPDSVGTTNINTAGLVPSINLQYLWDLIFDYYGWTYSGSLDINELWMTYPNALYFDDTGNITVGTADARLRGYRTENDQDVWRVQFYNETDNPTYVIADPATDIPNGIWANAFIFQQAGNYRVKFNIQGHFREHSSGDTQGYTAYLRVNGTYHEVTNESGSDEISVADIVAYNQTLVEVFIINPTNQGGILYVDSGTIAIETLGVQDVSFSEALIKLKVKDFFKEICIRRALTPFADADKKNIEFLSLDERMEADYIDVSDKFVSRKSERYVYDSYARANKLTHKYDNEGEDYSDGELIVDNENLTEEKKLYSSPTHAPQENLVEFKDSDEIYYVNNFKLFDVEVEESTDTGEITVKYKPLKNRFYIFESLATTRTIKIQGQPVSNFPLANINNNTYRDIVPFYYGNVNRILNNTRIHTIYMNFTAWDIANMDLRKKHYISQENSFYMINQINYKSGKFAEVEYVKVQTPDIYTDER